MINKILNNLQAVSKTKNIKIKKMILKVMQNHELTFNLIKTNQIHLESQDRLYKFRQQESNMNKITIAAAIKEFLAA